MAENKFITYATLGLVAVGTAATVWFVWTQSRSSVRGTLRRAKITPNNGSNRDYNLGYPSATRKFFGFKGQSSAKGFGAAAGAIPVISQLGTKGVISGKGGSGQGYVNREFQPKSNGYQNGKRRRNVIAAATTA